MGQKTHPTGFRTGITKDWKSRWYADGDDFGKNLLEDVRIRKFIGEKLNSAGVAGVEIERSPNAITVTIRTARPGIVIGRGGVGSTALKSELGKLTKSKLRLEIEEVRKPNLSAKLVADILARKIERRIPSRLASRRTIQEVMEAGAKGVKVTCSGVLRGASSIARRETAGQGSVPTSTLRADVDFASSTAKTNYGTIGVKVWIHRGEL